MGVHPPVEEVSQVRDLSSSKQPQNADVYYQAAGQGEADFSNAM